MFAENWKSYLLPDMFRLKGILSEEKEQKRGIENCIYRIYQRVSEIIINK